MNRHTLPFLIILTLLSCAEEGEVFFHDPGVRVQFINASGLSRLAADLKSTHAYGRIVDDTVRFYDDTLRVVADSLQRLDDRNAQYVSAKARLEQAQARFNAERELFRVKSDSLKTVKRKINDAISVIRSGKMRVSSIVNPENGAWVAFSDSAVSYHLPFSMNADSSQLTIAIEGAKYHVRFSYQREEVLDDKRRIKILISQAAIVTHSFDSISCNTSACEHETPIKLYF